MSTGPINRNAARRFLGELARTDGAPVPERTFARWIRERNLPCVKLGKEAAFYREQLSAWFNRQGRGFFA